MRKICVALAAALVLQLALTPFAAVHAAPAPLAEDVITSKAAILVDAATGTVLFEKNADEALPVASITKVMTLLLIFEALDAGRFSLNDTVTVSQYAAGMGGSQVLLDAGGNYLASDLIKSIIVASANDASVAMAEYLYGTEESFVAKMNERAKQLGMENTLFTNCNGLPNADEGMSARDVAVMSRELIRHGTYFQYSKIWMDELTHEGGRVTMLTNTNKLIRNYDGCDGIKTGFTNAAGFCLSASAKKGDTRMIAVVLGGTDSKTRFAVAEKLLNYGFSNYETKQFYAAGDVVQEGLEIAGLADGIFNVLAKDELSALIEKGEAQPEVEITLQENIEPPLIAGDVIGKARIRMGEDVIAETDLVVDRDIAAPGLADYWRNLLRQWRGAA